MKAFWKQHGALLLILAVALFLRGWGLPFGLPNLSRPDEQNISHTAVMNILNSFFQGQPDLNPRFFYYPSLYIYGLTLLYGIWYLVGHLLGMFADGARFIHAYLDDWTGFLLISRALTVAFGVLGVWALYRLALALDWAKSFARLAACLLAVTFLMVRDGHFGTTDVMAAFWVTLCLWQTVTGIQTQRPAALERAALFAGLAAATKYPTGLVLIAPVLGFYVWGKAQGARGQDFWERPSLLGQGLKLLGLAAGAFLLASPYILLDYPLFLEQFVSQSGMFNHLYAHQHLPMGWVRHATFTLWYGLGPQYLLAALLGAMLCWRRRRPAEIVLGVFALVYYLAIGATYSSYVRYVIPVVPVLCLAAVGTVRQLYGYLEARRPMTRMQSLALLTMAGLVIGGQSLWSSLQYDRILAQEDTRSQARAWLLAHLQAGDGVGIGKPLSHIDLPVRFRKYFLNVPERPEMAYGSKRQYMLQDTATVDDAPTERNERRLDTYMDVAALRRLNIHYVVVASAPLSFYDAPAAEVARLAKNPALAMAARFSGGEPLPPEAAYDFIDAFYVPMRALEQVRRPGPTITVYRVLPVAESPSTAVSVH